jgi:hypothetical protein
MPQLCDGARFLKESFAECRVRGNVGVDHLDRDGTIERQIAGKKHRPHPALAKHAVDGVLRADRRAQRVQQLVR